MLYSKFDKVCEGATTIDSPVCMVFIGTFLRGLFNFIYINRGFLLCQHLTMVYEFNLLMLIVDESYLCGFPMDLDSPCYRPG